MRDLWSGNAYPGAGHTAGSCWPNLRQKARSTADEDQAHTFIKSVGREKGAEVPADGAI